jgi:hypothetical protein
LPSPTAEPAVARMMPVCDANFPLLLMCRCYTFSSMEEREMSDES